MTMAQDTKLPVATQWTLDAAGPIQRNAVKSVLMLVCPRSSNKGTGFVLKSGLVVTANHVVAGCGVADIVAFDASGRQIHFQKVAGDQQRDLALLRPASPLGGGLELAPDNDPELGAAVSTWGFPLGYNGPSPLLSVGYLSGFIGTNGQSQVVKHLVVNGAFNPGNSGGPLFQAGGDKVIGVVVSKHAPLTPFVASAIDALSKNPSGVVFTATDAQGKTRNFVESQVVAEVLLFFRSLTQVMIGEAVAVSELRAFISARENEVR